MSTWQMFSDVDNSFRWEMSDQHHHPVDGDVITHSTRNDSNSTPLPSMADLLLQECSKLTGNHQGKFESPAMFQSGLGKPVTVKQSSISKALSILDGDEGNTFDDTGHVFTASNKRCTFPDSMFQTGLGKRVNISSAGLVKAKTLLGLQENHIHDDLFGIDQLKNQSNKLFGWKNSSYLETEDVATTRCNEDATTPLSTPNVENNSFHSGVKSEPLPELANSWCPPIKFHSAGGRSISVSSDALRRAKSLLGDVEHESLFDEVGAAYPAPSFFKQGRRSDDNMNNGNNSFSTFNHQEIDKSKHFVKGFVSPLRSATNQHQSSILTGKLSLRNNLIERFDAEDHNSISKTSNTHFQQNLPGGKLSSHVISSNNSENDVNSRTSRGGSTLGMPLGDISNTMRMIHKSDKVNGGLKRSFGRGSVSSFKKPRTSRFITPVKNVLPAPSGTSCLATEKSYSRRRVSSKYPFQGPRIYVEEYFGVPSLHLNLMKQLPDHIRKMSPGNAEKYLFPDSFCVECIGPEAFYHMLSQSGASMNYISKKWVANHYKWIVWKLACFERCYPCKTSGKLFKESNVLEELKYRYEREVNHGHRSAIKRILEGDQPPSSVLVLCISSICSNHEATSVTSPTTSSHTEHGTSTKVELTDGWYSVHAFLDVHLTKILADGKIFVGQKLRICGAGLCGWAGPVSPLEESSTVGLLLHINGTYRAHWADRLGLCKAGSIPLAFKCIKAMGGPVPCTLVGVTRIYPVLYKERLSNGGNIVRTERMEAKKVQLYSQRRSAVAEGIMSEFQREFHAKNDSDSEEGAKILKILEAAAEPELLMAEMTPEQLSSFATYRAKLEEIRQSDMQKSMETALECAGLSSRDVTPFMRVRVVGLTYDNCKNSGNSRKGLITIWNPCDKQQLELVEGRAYAVTGLIPSSLEADTLHLHARGSTTKWAPLTSSSIKKFDSFFSPRKSILLSHLGEVPLSSEFDVAAIVIYVGEVYKDVHQKTQWLFVADGSMSKSPLRNPSNSLLAISFSLPCIDGESVSPVSHNLVGSAIGLCNLLKRATDQVNHVWVAEATENSIYFLSYDGLLSSHLKEAAASAERWAKISSSIIEELREKVLYIIGDNKG